MTSPTPTQPTSTPDDNEIQKFNSELNKRCLEFIESYRKGTSTKAQAIRAILDALLIEEAREIRNGEKLEAAFVQFIQILDEVDDDRRDAAVDAANRVGGGAAGQDDAEGFRTRAGDRHAEKRARDGDSEDEDSSGDSQRRKLDESLLPFVNAGNSHLSPDLQLSLKLKENYTRDLKTARQRVTSEADCPDVPPSIWKDVLSNGYVDLDRVFSGVYTLDGDVGEIHRLGDYEIHTGNARPDRHIRTHGDWAVAWARYVQGVVYAFPHRERELHIYEDYVIGLFAALPGNAERVLRFDRAVRTRVGRSNHTLLSDFAQFNDLYTMHIVSAAAGGGATEVSVRSNTSKPRSNEICRRFNDGKCTSRSCKYRHICSNCHGNDHAACVCQNDSYGAGPSKGSGASGSGRK